MQDNHLSPLLKLAIPLTLTGVLESGVFFFETLFIAKLGAEPLAAGALVSWLFWIFAVILFGILSAINILVSHQVGQRHHQNIALIFRDGCWLAILLVIPAFILFWHMPKIFLLIGQPEEIIHLAEAYLHALTWGLLPNVLLIALLEGLIGLGHTRIIVKCSLVSVSSNIFFSYAFISGKFGFPELGIAGAGWGMTCSYWFSFILLILYLFFKKSYYQYLTHLFHVSPPVYLKELLRIGIPMGFMYSFEVAFFFTLSLFMGLLGSQVLAANQIAMQYIGTILSIVYCVAQAVTVRMGHLIGSNQHDAAKHTAYLGIRISFGLMLIASCFYWFMPTALIALDIQTENPDNANIIQYTCTFLAIGALFQILESVRITLFSALRSLKDIHYPLLVSVFCFWILALPAGSVLARYAHLGGQGLWWGMVIGALCSVVLLYWRFKVKMAGLAQKRT